MLGSGDGVRSGVSRGRGKGVSVPDRRNRAQASGELLPEVCA